MGGGGMCWYVLCVGECLNELVDGLMCIVGCV